MHRVRVILWEWVDRRGTGALSGYSLQAAQQAKLDERLDRIEEIGRLTFEGIKGLIFPFVGRLKKIKLHGNAAVRPILVLGPFDREHELTFLFVAKEDNNELQPPNAADIANERLEEILRDRTRRKRYERD